MTCPNPAVHRVRYRFSHRAGGRYFWVGPRIDSRVEQVSCPVAWFWRKP